MAQGGSTDFSACQPGDAVEYFSQSADTWIPTSIHEVADSGFSVACKKGRLLPFQNPPGVRCISGASAAGSEVGASAAGSGVVSDSPPGVIIGRSRGEIDPWWTRKVREALQLHKGTKGIFAHYEQKYPNGDPQMGLGRMLCSEFPLGDEKASARRSPDSTRGPLHPSSFAFATSAWDLFFVYDSDFEREVMAIVVDGLPQPGLHVQPFGQVAHNTFFAWKPDGEYRVFVRIAAILFIAISSVEDGVRNPEWLVSDLSVLPASCSHHANGVRRGLVALKNTILASKQNRAADPLMIDHMLMEMCSNSATDALSAVGSGQPSAVGSGIASKTTPESFINRYNASVSYDQSLVLKDNAARRQQNLRDPAKCTAAMKFMMRAATEEANSFADTGLSLEIMALPELWAGNVFIGTTHPMWAQYGRTCEDSCLRALKILLASAKKGCAFTSQKFKAVARRLGFAVAVSRGIFGRRSVSQAICEDMVKRVEEGLYDDDIDNIINDCDEGAPHSDDLSMDRHLAEVSQFVQDGLELHETACTANPEAEARLEKAAAMDDEEWFVAEVEHEVGAFLKARGARVKLVDALKGKKDAWHTRVDCNVKEATASFAEQHAPFVKLDLDAPAEFQKALSERMAFLARERRVDVQKVLVAFGIDLSVLGGVTDEALKLCDVALQLLKPRDILIVIAHGAPSAAGSVSAGGSVPPSRSGVMARTLPGLPVAPSEIGVASNKATIRAQLVAEFDKVMDKMKGAPCGGQLLRCFFIFWGGGGGHRLPRNEFSVCPHLRANFVS